MASNNVDVSFLFEAFPFGARTLRNRIVMAPMTRRKSPTGVPGENVADYYARRAEGGVGLIITEGCSIGHPGSAAFAGVPVMYGEAALLAWSRIIERVHRSGAGIVPQLWHVGAERRPGGEVGPELGYGPMEIRENGDLVVKAMTRDDIEAVTQAYVNAALAAQRAGFDGVEIHGAHGYLLDQFMWRKTNLRIDCYGGDLSGRTRFPVEVVKAIRGAVGPDFPIVFRLSQWKSRDYQAKLVENVEELSILTSHLREAGVDMLHISTRRFWEPAFEGSLNSLSAWARALSGLPVIAVGSVGLDKIHEPAATRDLNKVDSKFADLRVVKNEFDAGAFDLIAVGRGLLAEPDWAWKVHAGRVDKIKPVTRDAYEALVL